MADTDTHQELELAPPQCLSSQSSVEAMSPNGSRVMRIGCALLPKKVSRYLTPAVKAIAREEGIELCEIDPARPLHEQGDFDAILHKLPPNPEWEKNLLEYCKRHPTVACIDRVDGIRTLQNRSTMLNAFDGDGIALKGMGPKGIRIQAPPQVEVPEGTTLQQAQQLLQAAGMHFPLLVKPLWTDGREGSHGLAVLHDTDSLQQVLSGQVPSELQPPLVVQQFVQHGGVLFKVYVVGDKTVVSRRPSLGDKYLGKQKKGLLQLPRISCKSHGNLQALAASQRSPRSRSGSGSGSATPIAGSSAPDDPAPISTCPLSLTPLPPHNIMHALGSVLRQRLGLQLFNFDLICPDEQSASEILYYVIDINYFPGVDKIANFEQVFIDFLKSATLQHRGRAQREQQRRQQEGLSGVVMAAGLLAGAPSEGAQAQTSLHTDSLVAS